MMGFFYPQRSMNFSKIIYCSITYFTNIYMIRDMVLFLPISLRWKSKISTDCIYHIRHILKCFHLFLNKAFILIISSAFQDPNQKLTIFTDFIYTQSYPYTHLHNSPSVSHVIDIAFNKRILLLRSTYAISLIKERWDQARSLTYAEEGHY